MTKKVLDAVNEARKFFEIEDFPGDFFTFLNRVNYTEKYNLLLFKEDIDKLSGFIGYSNDDMIVICVNYKRSYGHQNFTLVHEIGHWFLHKGKSISDDEKTLGDYKFNPIEREANEFAKELLYPEKKLIEDFNYAKKNGLFRSECRVQLGYYVNLLCHKYCLSFELVLRNLLFKNRQAEQYNQVRKDIEKKLGGKISEYFDKDFYVPNEELPQYKKLMKPYEDLQRKVDFLVEKGKIGKPTGDSIKLRNGVTIE